MAIRPIIRMGHPSLRQVAEPYPVESIGSPTFDQLVEDLTDTLAASGGIGLAAPQINARVQVALVHIPGGPHRYGDLETVPPTIYVNPVIQVLGDSRQGYWEGCLSVPGLRGFVVRPQRIAIDYFDREGKPQQTEVTGFTATVFQHEFDHLQAKLYIDHIEDSRLLVFEDQFLEHDVDERTQSLQEEITRGIL